MGGEADWNDKHNSNLTHNLMFAWINPRHD
jgi:hypothetical protein